MASRMQNGCIVWVRCRVDYVKPRGQNTKEHMTLKYRNSRMQKSGVDCAWIRRIYLGEGTYIVPRPARKVRPMRRYRRRLSHLRRQGVNVLCGVKVWNPN